MNWGHWITVYINYETLTPVSINSLALHRYIQAHPYMSVYKSTYRIQGIKSIACIWNFQHVFVLAVQ